MENLNLKMLVKSLVQEACSLIDDTNLMRTIQRIEFFFRLCDDFDFLYGFCERLMKLQRQKEQDQMTGDIAKNWLVKEAASAKSINEFCTLKKSCKHFIQSKLSPLMGFMIAKMDSYSNFDVLVRAIETREKWSRSLWLKIFKDENVFKLNYVDMRKRDVNEELKRFQCNSSLCDQNLRINFPFFWLLIESFNDLTHNFFNSFVLSDTFANNDEPNYETFMKTMPSLFGKIRIFQVVEDICAGQELSTIDFIKLYLNDFVLFNFKVAAENELIIIQNIFSSVLPDVKQLTDVFAFIHFRFKVIEKQVKTFLEFSNFEPGVKDQMLYNGKYEEIDVEACLLCIEIFEKKSNKMSLQDEMKRVSTTLKVVILFQKLTAFCCQMAKNWSALNSNKKHDFCQKHAVFSTEC